MPITFYPHKPIELLEEYIQKDDGTPLHGEIDVYRFISDSCGKSQKEWYVWHDLNLPFHTDTYNPKRKSNAQIDFLVLCDYGLLILEVKGGPISYKDQVFYYGNNCEQAMSENPFSQAKGYKYTIIDELVKSKDVFVCHAVAFPHSKKTFTSILLEGDVLWTAATLDRYNESFEDFLLHVYQHGRSKMSYKGNRFRTLDRGQIDRLIRTINPIVTDPNRYYSRDTEKWLNVANLEIIESLSRNDRIMIEGGPGTGKTTLALAYIDKQIGKQGLFLCWNNLFKSKISHQLTQRGLRNHCEVYTLSQFLLHHDSTLKAENLLSRTELEFASVLGSVISNLKSSGRLPLYDYVIVDEGQDVIDRGIDTILDELSDTNGNGLHNGRSLFFYDLDQGYFSEGRDLVDHANLLSSFYAHYKLNENKRSAQSPLIRQFANDILSCTGSTLDETFESWTAKQEIDIKRFRNFQSIRRQLINDVLAPMRNKENSLKGCDCILLIEPGLLALTDSDKTTLDYHLVFDDMTTLDEENINDTSNILRYTTILRFKGLEKQNVFLLTNKPSEKNRYQIFIGATRAICNLHVLIYDPV